MDGIRLERKKSAVEKRAGPISGADRSGDAVQQRHDESAVARTRLQYPVAERKPSSEVRFDGIEHVGDNRCRREHLGIRFGRFSLRGFRHWRRRQDA